MSGATLVGERVTQGTQNNLSSLQINQRKSKVPYNLKRKSPKGASSTIPEEKGRDSKERGSPKRSFYKEWRFGFHVNLQSMSIRTDTCQHKALFPGFFGLLVSRDIWTHQSPPRTRNQKTPKSPLRLQLRLPDPDQEVAKSWLRAAERFGCVCFPCGSQFPFWFPYQPTKTDPLGGWDVLVPTFGPPLNRLPVRQFKGRDFGVGFDQTP